jgi:hypothetical protein
MLLALPLCLLAIPMLPADEKKAAQDALVLETIKIIKDTTKILKDVTNKEQAEKAKKDLTPILDKLADLKKRYNAAGELTKEQDTELQKKYEAELSDATKAFVAEAKRLLNTDYGKDLVNLIQQKAKP